jgi:hypothetical protein
MQACPIRIGNAILLDRDTMAPSNLGIRSCDKGKKRLHQTLSENILWRLKVICKRLMIARQYGG